MRPRMIVIADPPGSGKSTAFPVHSFEMDAFNADDRSAEMNMGRIRASRLKSGRRSIKNSSGL
jgi:hypothetical protein